ncbi:MAG: hypothetical protein ACJ8J0_03270, partial [Longimicrobiaceae bacterium]
AVETLQAEIGRVLREMGVDGGHPVTLERPRNPDHGDWATNVALTLAKPLARPPRQIADELARRIDTAAAGVSSVEVAGRGSSTSAWRRTTSRADWRRSSRAATATGAPRRAGGRG